MDNYFLMQPFWSLHAKPWGQQCFASEQQDALGNGQQNVWSLPLQHVLFGPHWHWFWRPLGIKRTTLSATVSVGKTESGTDLKCNVLLAGFLVNIGRILFPLVHFLPWSSHSNPDGQQCSLSAQQTAFGRGQQAYLPPSVSQHVSPLLHSEPSLHFTPPSPSFPLRCLIAGIVLEDA